MNLSNSLQQAFDLSDQILTAIGQQNLDDISSLEEKRKVVIEQCYLNSNAIDDRLTRLLKQKNDQIVSQLVEMQQQIRS
ncbi:MAG: hypothetical protein KAU21_00780, partial [Gammaproteobacteria bacterium]|nr:hypothetical protein [Gammaproteobacteria bacterium]